MRERTLQFGSCYVTVSAGWGVCLSLSIRFLSLPPLFYYLALEQVLIVQLVSVTAPVCSVTMVFDLDSSGRGSPGTAQKSMLCVELAELCAVLGVGTRKGSRRLPSKPLPLQAGKAVCCTGFQSWLRHQHSVCAPAPSPSSAVGLLALDRCYDTSVRHG